MWSLEHVFSSVSKRFAPVCTNHLVEVIRLSSILNHIGDIRNLVWEDREEFGMFPYFSVSNFRLDFNAILDTRAFPHLKLNFQLFVVASSLSRISFDQQPSTSKCLVRSKIVDPNCDLGGFIMPAPTCVQKPLLIYITLQVC